MLLAVEPPVLDASSQWASTVGLYVVPITLLVQLGVTVYNRWAAARDARNAAIAAEAVAKKVEEAKAAAESVAKKVEGVASDLTTKDAKQNDKLDAIHGLVNSAMAAQLKISAIALRRLADTTKHVGDIAAADLAEKILHEHEARQAVIDKAAPKGRT